MYVSHLIFSPAVSKKNMCLQILKKEFIFGLEILCNLLANITFAGQMFGGSLVVQDHQISVWTTEINFEGLPTED